MRSLAVLLAAFLWLALPGWAKDALPAAADPALERRVTALAEQLRCLVCQNQSLADSHAQLAIDLKDQVREKLAQGMAEEAILEYMVARYGDFVLYRPPLRAATVPLWFGPIALLALGLAVAIGFLWRRRRSPHAVPLTEDERAAAAALLDVPAKAGPP